jgi:hypothetical protein
MDRATLETVFANENANSALLIDAAVQFMAHIRQGGDPLVRPGSPETFTEACVPGDGIRQGDIYIKVLAKRPVKGYVAVKELTPENLQLVPGNTKGSRHVLDSWDGVKMYRPKVWNGDQFRGPILVLTKTRTIRHEEHGSVTLTPGKYGIYYQRERDALAAIERRRLD